MCGEVAGLRPPLKNPTCKETTLVKEHSRSCPRKAELNVGGKPVTLSAHQKRKQSGRCDTKKKTVESCQRGP